MVEILSDDNSCIRIWGQSVRAQICRNDFKSRHRIVACEKLIAREELESPNQSRAFYSLDNNFAPTTSHSCAKAIRDLELRTLASKLNCRKARC